MLKAIVADLESVEENHRTLYVERDGGGFILNVEPVDGFAVQEVSGLKSALSSERRKHTDVAAELRAAQARIETFGDLDPEAARDALKRLADGPVDVESIVKARVDGMRAGIAEAAGAEATAARVELENVRGTLSKREAQLQRLALDNVLQSELARVKPLDDAADALMLMAAQHVKMVEEDGELVARVVDRKGDLRLDGKGQPFTISAFMAEMRDTRPSLFQPTKHVTGLGTSPSDRGSGASGPGAGQANPWSAASWNLTHQATLSARNPSLAARFRAEAGAR